MRDTIFKLGIFYHFFPHYRAGIIRAIASDPELKATFVSGRDGFDGIKPYVFCNGEEFLEAPYVRLGRFFFQPKIVLMAFRSDFDAVIFLANPYFITTWLSALIFRLRGRHVIFWTHGWLKKRSMFVDWLKSIFLSIAHDILVYGPSAKNIGEKKGFRRISVVFNSLDYSKQVEIRVQTERGLLGSACPDSFRRRGAFLITCTGRLVKEYEFELLINAISILEAGGLKIDLALVGDGSEKENLAAIATTGHVNTHFFGECYDDKIIGPILFSSDLTVYPGKVGLSAIHSLVFGTPVITHNLSNTQMPEYEAIKPGVTGAFFKKGSVLDLAETIRAWLLQHSDRDATRRACYSIIDEYYNPQAQMVVLRDVLFAKKH